MENTYHDLLDCVQNWNEVESKLEKKFRENILSLCKDIVDEFSESDDSDNFENDLNGDV